MEKIANSALDLVGNTPLVELSHLGREAVTFNERIILQNNYSSVISDIILMQKIISGKGKRGLMRMSLYIVRVVAVGLAIRVKSTS